MSLKQQEMIFIFCYLETDIITLIVTALYIQYVCVIMGIYGMQIIELYTNYNYYHGTDRMKPKYWKGHQQAVTSTSSPSQRLLLEGRYYSLL